MNCHKDAKKVLLCLQRALKIANTCMGSQVHLFIEILNKYIYFYNQNCTSIKPKYIHGLINLIEEHISSLDDSTTSRNIKQHYQNTLQHINKKKQNQPDFLKE